MKKPPYRSLLRFGFFMAGFGLLSFGISQAAEVPAPPADAKITYKAGKDVNFEELLIKGELKRPEISIVTGNVQQGTDGLLRLRENFKDRITMDAGEEIQ